ncbi:MAG: hypothetical protein ACI31R_03770 [Bacilli bacterium]
MKKVISVFMTFLIGFCFIANVNAEEVSLNSIASIISNVGGEDKEIIQTDSSNTYKFYYKYVAIDSDSFNSYVGSKYVVDNASNSSDEYATAQSQVAEYESTFKSLISEAKSTDLESWTLASDGQISLSDLVYESNKHNGYVLAIAALKDGDTNTVYIERLILESTSSTTLGQITYTAEDEEAYGTYTTVTNSNTAVSTSSNPSTGISDYAIYIVPVCIILGSAILLRKSYS